MELKVWMLNRNEVCKVLGTSSAGLHRGMVDGRYPKPYRTSERSVRWKSNEIQETVDNLQVAVPIEVAPGSKRGRKPSNFLITILPPPAKNCGVVCEPPVFDVAIDPCNWPLQQGGSKTALLQSQKMNSEEDQCYAGTIMEEINNDY